MIVKGYIKWEKKGGETKGIPNTQELANALFAGLAGGAPSADVSFPEK